MPKTGQYQGYILSISPNLLKSVSYDVSTGGIQWVFLENSGKFNILE